MKLAFLDLETTGLDFKKHCVLDVAIVIADFVDNTNKSIYASCIKRDAIDFMNADNEALEINGFSENNSQLAKSEMIVRVEIEEFLLKNDIVQGKAFFVCQNPSFDRPFFNQILSTYHMKKINLPYHWLDLASMYWIKYFGFWDSSEDVSRKFSLSKDSIAKSLGIEEEKKPHKALSGALHLMKCYNAMKTCDFVQFAKEKHPS